MNTKINPQQASFLQRKNIEISFKRYGIDAMSAMALGLFSSLLVGLILKTIGDKIGAPWLVDIGHQAMQMAGPAIGVAVAYSLKAPPLVLFSSCVSGAAGYLLGGPAGSFIAALVGAEFGKLIAKETKVDILITPAITIIIGVSVGALVGPEIKQLMIWIGQSIMWATERQPLIMGALIAFTMGLCLTAPISSAAIAIMLGLNGSAAGAATVGCCCQMIGFAVASYRENRFGGLVAQGLGTSMLQVPNILRNPLIIIPPTLSAIILGPLATTLLPMSNIPIGAGMGTAGLVGQFGTYTAMRAAGESLSYVCFTIGLLHFVLPAILTLLFAEYLRHKGWIKFGDMKLDI